MVFDARRSGGILMAQTYANYSLPQLWAVVAVEDPETGFAHVNALNRLRAAIEQQRDNLRGHRDRLMEGWPPERSDASAAFVGRINDLIDALTYMARATGQICVGVDETYASIRDARRQLESLHAGYPRSTGQGIAVARTSDPALDQRGRDVMIAADGRIADAAKSYSTPLPTPTRSIEPGSQIIENDSESSGSTASVSTGGGRSVILPPPVFEPPPAVGGGSGEGGTEGGGTQADPLDDGPGTVLAGDPPSRSPLPPSGGAGGGYPTSGPVGVIGGDPRPGGPAVSPGIGVGLRPGAVGAGGVIGGPRPSNPSAERVPGAPIGGVPPRVSSAQAGRPRRAVSPSAPSESSSAGRAAGPAGAFRDRSYEEYAERRRSKRGGDDELWSVEEGVPPVLDAAPQQRHEPGPGVLGIDR
ncbi:hypothetical protein [Dactylosporangium sp. CA-139066]|uniref:hypothetical protein n=1 Tax=Dactylosporangium sp. CA-139066 TaxID=3239930 RepID=UPI003D90376D